MVNPKAGMEWDKNCQAKYIATKNPHKCQMALSNTSMVWNLHHSVQQEWQ